jgi:O-antigen/teichoic acid export membrane protein
MAGRIVWVCFRASWLDFDRDHRLAGYHEWVVSILSREAMFMLERPAQKAGKALVWQIIQLGGDKLLFFIRILILARLLTPQDFGLVAIATTAIGFFQNITDIGLIPALVQGKEITEKQYNLVWTVEMIRASLITIVMVIAAPLIAMIFDEPQAAPIIRVFAFYPLLTASISIKIAEQNRNLSFRPLALLKLTESLVKAVVSIAFAVVFGFWGLIIGTLAGVAALSILSYILAPHRPRLVLDWESIRPLINFGRWMFINSLIALAGGIILRVVITRQLGAAALGLYYLATQLAYLPTEVSSGVVGSVAFPMFSRLQSDLERIKRAFRTMIVGTAALLYPACLLIIVLAPTFVTELFGSKWDGTETIIQILSLATMIGIFGDIVVEILKGMGRPDKMTLMGLMQTLALIALVSLLTSRFGIIGAALASLPAILVSQILGIVFVGQLIPQPLSGLGKPLKAVIIASLTGAMVAFVLDKYLAGVIGLVVAGIGAVFCTLVILWIANQKWSLGLTQDLMLIFPGISRFVRIFDLQKTKP